MAIVRIYVLVDPRDGEFRYVGKTTQKIETRIVAHLQDKSKCHRVNWLNELKREGLKPDCFVVEEVDGEWPWQESERFWIRYLRKIGANLTNNTIGGDGVPGLPQETREAMRRVWLGRKHKPETIEKLKHCRKNFRHTKETRLRMSRSQLGRKITWTKKIAEALRKANPEKQAEIKRLLDSGMKVCNVAEMFNLHRTTVSKIKLGTYNLPYRKQK